MDIFFDFKKKSALFIPDCEITRCPNVGNHVDDPTRVSDGGFDKQGHPLALAPH